MASAESESVATVRVPTQTRAKRTVAAILKATTDLLVEGGMEAVNTNAVAKAAGVNVSTVYSYFPDKAAIVRQLAQQFEDTRFAYVERMFAAFPEADWREWYPDIIDRLVEFRLDTPGAVAIRTAVRSNVELRHIDADSTSAAAELMVTGMLERGVRLDEDRLRSISRVVVHTITEMIDTAFAANPPDLQIIEELKLLVARYLTPYLGD